MTMQTASRQEFDVAIVGGGPAGYVAALRASQLKLRTALVEREHLGGVCLNWGCIPTKALLHSADTVRRIRQAHAEGIVAESPQIDFARIMQRSRTASQRLNRGVAHLLKKAGVKVFSGSARLQGKGRLEVSGADGQAAQQIAAAHIILATGARPRELPALPFDGERVWSYREALSATQLPASLLVIGAGAIGLEFASFYATLGCSVTVVEAAPRVLPSGDEEVSDFVRQAMEQDGVRFLTGARLASADVTAGHVQAVVESDAGQAIALQAERALVAVGLVGNTEHLGLEHCRAVINHGLIEAGDWGATQEPGLYAIGDVTGPPMLAHKASHEGIACVEHIARLHAGRPPQALRARAPAIPACVYSHPQSASIGLTEAQARAAHPDVKVGKFPLQGNGKAVAIGEAAGFIKTIFSAASGELLGAHLVGPEVTELVHGYAVAQSLEATEAELIETVFPHPTLSEAMHESVLAAYGRALHM